VDGAKETDGDDGTGAPENSVEQRRNRKRCEKALKNHSIDASLYVCALRRQKIRTCSDLP
jgi:hypothetical protein